MSDEGKDPFALIQQEQLRTREQVINMIEDHIVSLRDQLGKFPGPMDAVNSKAYVKWERLTMSWIGRVTEALSMARMLNLLPPEQAERLHVKATGAINYLMVKMITEGNRL